MSIKIKLVDRLANFATPDERQAFVEQATRAVNGALLWDNTTAFVFLGGWYRHVDHAMTMDYALVNKYDYPVNGIRMNFSAQLKSSQKTNPHLEVTESDMVNLMKAWCCG